MVAGLSIVTPVLKYLLAQCQLKKSKNALSAGGFSSAQNLELIALHWLPAV
jgi:hypothetical protein